MKLPDKVRIGPVTIDVTVSEAEIDALSVRAGVYGDGWSHYSNQEIVLRESLPPDRLRAVFVHELLHLLWSNIGLEKWVPKKYEEPIVNSLAPALTDLLLRNVEVRRLFDTEYECRPPETSTCPCQAGAD